MLIQTKQVGAEGSFYVEENGKILAEMVWWMKREDLMVIIHTEVSDELRGKNVGYSLVRTAVEYARENHLKIFPLCPFAKSVFDKKGEAFADVLAATDIGKIN